MTLTELRKYLGIVWVLRLPIYKRGSSKYE